MTISTSIFSHFLRLSQRGEAVIVKPKSWRTNRRRAHSILILKVQSLSQSQVQFLSVLFTYVSCLLMVHKVRKRVIWLERIAFSLKRKQANPLRTDFLEFWLVLRSLVPILFILEYVHLTLCLILICRVKMICTHLTKLHFNWPWTDSYSLLSHF